MKVQHSIVNNNKLNTVPVTNGQIVYVKDTHDLYFDVDSTRTKATDIIFVSTLQERDSIQSPTPNKVYCVLEDGCFYTYKNNAWTLLGGNVTKSYVDTADGNTLTSAQGYADSNFLKKTNTTAFTPTADYHPSTKKYVDDGFKNYVPMRAFPSSVNITHTTTTFINSLKALNMNTGDMLLGTVHLTDMPDGIVTGAEVKVEVYNNNVVYLTMTSANVSPYVWTCNSHSFRGWEPAYRASGATFDNTGTDLEATSVEDALVEINDKIGTLNTLIEEINGE